MIDRVVTAIIEEVKHLKHGTDKFEEETTAILTVSTQTSSIFKRV